MSRKDYMKKVKEIMINKNFYSVCNNDFYNLDHNTSVNSQVINNMPHGSMVILNENVYSELIAIKDVAFEEGIEIPFFLFGKEIEENVVEFDGIYSSIDEYYTNYDGMLESISNLSLDEDRFVVAKGHSNANNNVFDFSLGDFADYMEMQDYLGNNTELTGCFLTKTGDINFIYYDRKTENYYRFVNVFVKDVNNKYKQVDCYGKNFIDKPSCLTRKLK